MATQRTVKQRARTLQTEAKERGENLPYTAALRMAEAHGITPKRPADRTLVQVLESLFTDDHQLFISASDDLERLKTEGLEEVFEDEEVEAFTVQQGNVYEAILTEWSVYDTPAQAMSVYGYTDENDLSDLTEHRLVDVWWELGHFKKLGDEYENKVTAVFAATEGAGEPTASYILSDLERFDMEELLAEVLGDALKVSNPNVFEDVLGDVSEMLSLEFMALLAHPYIGKYEGWTQEAYGKVVAFWNENFDTPVHPLDTTETSTETAPSPAVTQGNPQHILKSYDQWHGKELFVYHSGELEMLRQGLDEVLEDEIDGTFTISDNIFQWIIDTHDTIGTPLEELSIYAYPSDQVNELVEYPLVEQWWEVGQWAEIMQHYFSDSNQAVPSPDDMLQHQQRVKAITPALLTALTQGYGLETTDPVLGATVQEDSALFPSLTALLCRRFIGQYEGWDQAAYEAAAHLWNGYYEKPLHPLDAAGIHNETTADTDMATASDQHDPQHILKSYDQWHGKELFVYHSGEVETLRQGVEKIEDIFTTKDSIFSHLLNRPENVYKPLGELSIYAYTPGNVASTLREFPLANEWEELGQWLKIIQIYQTGEPHTEPQPCQHDLMGTKEEIEAHVAILEAVFQQEYKVDEEGLWDLESWWEVESPNSQSLYMPLLALLCRRFIGKHEGWDQAAYDATAYMWNNYWGTPLHPKDQLPQDAPVQPNPGDAVLAPYSQRVGHFFYYYAPEGTPSSEYAQSRILKFPVQDWAKGLAGFIRGHALTPVKPALAPSHIALYFYDSKAGTVERVCTVVELFPNVDFAAVARYEAKHRLIFQDPISSTSSAYWKLLGGGSWSCKEYDAWLEIEGLLNTKYRVRYFREINNAFDTVNLISYELMALMGREYLMQSESGRALYDKATSAWRRAVDQLHPDDPVLEPFMLNK